MTMTQPNPIPLKNLFFLETPGVMIRECSQALRQCLLDSRQQAVKKVAADVSPHEALPRQRE